MVGRPDKAYVIWATVIVKMMTVSRITVFLVGKCQHLKRILPVQIIYGSITNQSNSEYHQRVKRFITVSLVRYLGGT